MGKILLITFRILSRYGWTATLIILGLFAVGFTWSSSDDLYANIRLFDKAALTVTSNYVEPVNETELITAGIEGMVSKLDNYSKYLSGPEYYFLLQETDGEFEGIGVSLEFHHDTLTIESVLKGTPAYYRGLMAGDRVLSIDGQSTNELEISRVRMLLRGQAETSVKLRVLRPGQGLINVDVVREIVKVDAIPYFGMINSQVGYIRLARFSEESSQEVKRAIRFLKKNGAQTLIIDLRDNPGGLLIEAVKIAGMFLPQGAAVVTTRGRTESPSTIYTSEGEDDFQEGGLAIIVNGQTASAAEILAGAVQDNDRGIIVGSPTFGKGLVQQILQFTENSALKLTTSKYYLPSGRCLQKPDWSTFALSENRGGHGGDSIFATVSGRPVFGGGGIMPDIFIDIAAASDYIEFLRSESCFFDFGLEYIRDHTFSEPFSVNEALIAEFRKFLELKGSQFVSTEREAFQNLKEKLGTPGEKVSQALKAIDAELKRKDDWRFESNHSEMRNELYETIISLALGKAEIYRQVWFPNQAEITEAVEILSDSSHYTRILAVN
jgi:carboxyl-terminal processing protease